MTAQRLGEILKANKSVSETVLVDAVKRAKADGKRLGEELLKLGAISEHDLYSALAEQTGHTFGSTEAILEALDRDLVSADPDPTSNIPA